MIIRATMLLATISYIIFNVTREKKPMNHNEKTLYIILVVPIVYLSIIFVTKLPWLNLDEFLRIILDNPSRSFTKLFSSE